MQTILDLLQREEIFKHFNLRKYVFFLSVTSYTLMQIQFVPTNNLKSESYMNTNRKRSIVMLVASQPFIDNLTNSLFDLFLQNTNLNYEE